MFGAHTLDWIAGIWWRRVPRAVAHLSTYLWAVATDGLYLVLWPRVAAFATPMVWMLGLLIGEFRLGFHETFAESIAVMLVMIALGVMSGHLGTAFLIGFALGEYHSAEFAYASRPFLARLSHLIQYGVMAAILMMTPVVAKYLVGDLITRVTSRPDRRVAIAVIGYPVVTLALVFCWATAVPQLIRPSYLWPERYLPPHPLVAPLLGGSPWLVDTIGAWPLVLGVAALAAVARMAVQRHIVRNESLTRALDDAAERVQVRAPAWTSSRTAQALQVIVRPVWLTVLLAGVYDYDTAMSSALRGASLWQPALIFATALLLSVIRYRALPPLAWTAALGRLPLVARLLAAMTILYPLAYVIVRLTSDGVKFTPLVITIALSLALFHVVNPSTRAPAPSRTA